MSITVRTLCWDYDTSNYCLIQIKSQLSNYIRKIVMLNAKEKNGNFNPPCKPENFDHFDESINDVFTKY